MFASEDLFNLAKIIHAEREEGTKDMMEFLGLSSVNYWASYLYTVLTIHVPYLVLYWVLVIITFIKIEDKHSIGLDFGRGFYASFTFLICIINHSLFVFALTALSMHQGILEIFKFLVGFVLTMVAPIVLMYTYNDESFVVRFFLQFFPALNLAFGLRDSIETIHADTVIFYFVDFILWGYLVYYFDMVIPTSNGNRQKRCCFCCSTREDEAQSTGSKTASGRFLEVRNVTKKYGSFTAVDDLSLSLDRNQIYGLLGFNGAGKTTTVSMITGMIKPSSGSIFINGKDIAADSSVLRKCMGVCPQHNMLWPKLTVRAHLQLFSRLRGISDEKMESEIKPLLEELDMSHVIDVMAADLSGGQKRKLMVMQAFIGNPSFVLLDEPTAGVDIDSRTSIHNLILRQKKDKLIILITHHMQEADTLSDYLAIMADGKIMVQGTANQLKARYGSGISFHIPANLMNVSDFEKFEVEIEENNGVASITSVNDEELPDIARIVEAKVKKPHIEHNSLESVFLTLAKTRGQTTRQSTLISISDIDATELSLQEIVSREYHPAGYAMQVWLLLKKRAKLIYYEPWPLFVALVMVFAWGLAKIVLVSMIGADDTPLQFPSRSDLGSVTIYGTTMDSLTSQVIKDNLASFGDITGSFEIHDKASVLDGIGKYAYRVDGNSIDIFVDPFFYPSAPSLVSYLYTGERMNVNQKDELNLFSLLGPTIMAFVFVSVTTPVMSMIYEYTQRENDSGMFNFQRLLGVPTLMVELVSLVYDWGLGIILIAIFAGIQADNKDETEAFIVAWIVASIGFWFILYIAGRSGQGRESLLQTMFMMFLIVQIPVFALYFTEPEYLNWITGVADAPNGGWVLVKILFYFTPPLQFYTSALLMISKSNNIPGLDFSDSIMAKHWIFCWGVNVFWLCMHVYYAYAKTWLINAGIFKQPMDDTLRPAHGKESGENDITSDMLSKVYEDEAGNPLVAAREISFVNHSGRCLGVLGKNGAGKSTIMKILTTDIKQTLGVGTVLGRNIETKTEEIRDIIGICNQENILWDSFTARDHLSFFGILRGIHQDELHGVIEFLAAELKFHEHLDTKCAHLSGGNKRKLSLCTSLLGSTRALFLDEPSAGVDPFARDGMQRVLLKMKPGRCILFTSHTLEEAELMCDDIVIMVKGEIESMGTIDTLIEEFSEGYFLHIDVTDDVEDTIRTRVTTKFPMFKQQEATKKELCYIVPFDSAALESVFAFMNEIRNELSCHCVLQSASLRELFLHIVNDEEEAEDLALVVTTSNDATSV